MTRLGVKSAVQPESQRSPIESKEFCLRDGKIRSMQADWGREGMARSTI